MQIKTIEQLAEFLKTRDWINNKVYTICNKHGYSASINRWEIDGDMLVVHFIVGGTFHLATHFTRRFALTELFEEDNNDKTR